MVASARTPVKEFYAWPHVRGRLLPGAVFLTPRARERNEKLANQREPPAPGTCPFPWRAISRVLSMSESGLLARRAGLVALGTFASRILGLAQTSVVAALFSAGLGAWAVRGGAGKGNG